MTNWQALLPYAIWIGVGLTGSLVEWVGLRFKVPGLVDAGKRLEGLGSDVFKIFVPKVVK